MFFHFLIAVSREKGRQMSRAQAGEWFGTLLQSAEKRLRSSYITMRTEGVSHEDFEASCLEVCRAVWELHTVRAAFIHDNDPWNRDVFDMVMNDNLEQLVPSISHPPTDVTPLELFQDATKLYAIMRDDGPQAAMLLM